MPASFSSSGIDQSVADLRYPSLTNFNILSGRAKIILLGYGNVNMNSTNDQIFVLASSSYIITNIVFTNASINLNTAQGGFYTAATKGGTKLVETTQSYAALTAATKWMSCTLLAGAISGSDVLTNSNLFFSLTTAQGAAATATAYIYGIKLD